MFRLFVLLSLLVHGAPVFAGAWGTGSFDNDDAMDWVVDPERSSGHVKFSAVRGVNAESGYIQAPDCSIAIAEAEVIAAMKGRPSEELPTELAAWIESAQWSVPPDILTRTHAAVALCRNSERSELRELWLESEYADEWLEATGELLDRLGRL